jgi:hypothetical protein
VLCNKTKNNRNTKTWSTLLSRSKFSPPPLWLIALSPRIEFARRLRCELCGRVDSITGLRKVEVVVDFGVAAEKTGKF